VDLLSVGSLLSSCNDGKTILEMAESAEKQFAGEKRSGGRRKGAAYVLDTGKHDIIRSDSGQVVAIVRLGPRPRPSCKPTYHPSGGGFKLQ
jgi:hypothetical protein